MHDHAQALQFCGSGNSVDTGTTSGFWWYVSIDAEGSPDCVNRSIEYTYVSNTSPAVDDINVTLARAWTCGTLTYNLSPSAHFYNSQYGDVYGPWSYQNTCGWQADHQTHFIELGSLDLWKYETF